MDEALNNLYLILKAIGWLIVIVLCVAGIYQAMVYQDEAKKP